MPAAIFFRSSAVIVPPPLKCLASWSLMELLLLHPAMASMPRAVKASMPAIFFFAFMMIIVPQPWHPIGCQGFLDLLSGNYERVESHMLSFGRLIGSGLVWYGNIDLTCPSQKRKFARPACLELTAPF